MPYAVVFYCFFISLPTGSCLKVKYHLQEYDEEAQTSTSGNIQEEQEVPKLQRSPSVLRIEKDRSGFGLALYALSSCFLSTALVFAKKLSEDPALACSVCSACNIQ